MYSRGRLGGMLLFVLLGMSLQACLYSNEPRKENQQSVREGVLLVQHAIEEYQRETGLLPLVTSEQSAPRYEKFRVNFDLLKQRELLSVPPSCAFESGGTGIFLIIDEESSPKVRMMDLPTLQRAHDLERAVQAYKRAKGTWPRKEELYPGFYRIDEQSIGVRPSDIFSPFSRRTLSFMMDKQGRVYADYAEDIRQLVTKSKQLPAKDGGDVRTLLTESSFFVPVKSVAYIWKQQAPWPQQELSS